MAVTGVFGMPLLKGKSQAIITARVLGDLTALTAGRALFAIGTVSKGMQDLQTAQTAIFAGVTSTDFKISPVDTGEAVAGVLETGLFIPVRLKDGIQPSIDERPAITALGEFVNESDADAIMTVNGKWHTTDVGTAADEKGGEQRCGFVDLFGGTIQPTATPAP